MIAFYGLYILFTMARYTFNTIDPSYLQCCKVYNVFRRHPLEIAQQIEHESTDNIFPYPFTLKWGDNYLNPQLSLTLMLLASEWSRAEIAQSLGKNSPALLARPIRYILDTAQQNYGITRSYQYANRTGIREKISQLHQIDVKYWINWARQTPTPNVMRLVFLIPRGDSSDILRLTQQMQNSLILLYYSVMHNRQLPVGYVRNSLCSVFCRLCQTLGYDGHMHPEHPIFMSMSDNYSSDQLEIMYNLALPPFS